MAPLFLSVHYIALVVLGALLINERDCLLRKVVATAVTVLELTIILLSDFLGN